MEQIAVTIRRPWRVFNWWRIVRFLWSVGDTIKGRVGNWHHTPYLGAGMLQNTAAVKNYTKYTRRQQRKLDYIRPEAKKEHFARQTYQLLSEIHALAISIEGKRVLCLGSRGGAEVNAFLRAGAFAVGVDLRPPADCPFTVHGDFHSLVFAARSVDIVFTNAIDHSADPRRFLGEICRVLVPGGLFVLQAPSGSCDERPQQPGAFEVLWWERLQDLVNFVAGCGFEELVRIDSTYPYRYGCIIVFRVKGAALCLLSVMRSCYAR